jgi:ribosomal protein S18 acetylase RimI-like enzyme
MTERPRRSVAGFAGGDSALHRDIGSGNAGRVRDERHKQVGGRHKHMRGCSDIHLCMGALLIRKIQTSELELIEPLWNALREHHSSVVPSLGSPRSREDSWSFRRRQYASWLEDPQAFLLLAERGGETVGYTMVNVHDGSPTWPLSDRAGEIETLAVLPRERGHGTGTALLEAVRAELATRGIQEVSLHVIPTNTGAVRFYERHGFNTFALWVRARGPIRAR